ncbi:unnamed protein product [Echinostoma caproni]|uniref:Endo/exonuclease/phosphatase domain-containing protein n=1 Tax=Echinostoma caproni TaxID=27848 RepID=A0A183B413_9TREM|nr:unnamed protein product [Echinostoma caproni]
MTIGVWYRPPATVPVVTLDDMRRWDSDGHCLTLGDFNVPLNDWNGNSCLQGADRFSRDLAVVNQLALHQYSCEPTRINDSAQSVLDLVLSPPPLPERRTSIPSAISHHSVQVTIQPSWYIGAVELRTVLDHIPGPMSGKRTMME